MLRDFVVTHSSQNKFSSTKPVSLGKGSPASIELSGRIKASLPPELFLNFDIAYRNILQRFRRFDQNNNISTLKSSLPIENPVNYSFNNPDQPANSRTLGTYSPIKNFITIFLTPLIDEFVKTSPKQANENIIRQYTEILAHELVHASSFIERKTSNSDQLDLVRAGLASDLSYIFWIDFQEIGKIKHLTLLAQFDSVNSFFERETSKKSDQINFSDLLAVLNKYTKKINVEDLLMVANLENFNECFSWKQLMKIANHYDQLPIKWTPTKDWLTKQGLRNSDSIYKILINSNLRPLGNKALPDNELVQSLHKFTCNYISEALRNDYQENGKGFFGDLLKTIQKINTHFNLNALENHCKRKYSELSEDELHDFIQKFSTNNESLLNNNNSKEQRLSKQELLEHIERNFFGKVELTLTSEHIEELVPDTFKAIFNKQKRVTYIPYTGIEVLTESLLYNYLLQANSPWDKPAYVLNENLKVKVSYSKLSLMKTSALNEALTEVLTHRKLQAKSLSFSWDKTLLKIFEGLSQSSKHRSARELYRAKHGYPQYTGPILDIVEALEDLPGQSAKVLSQEFYKAIALTLSEGNLIYLRRFFQENFRVRVTPKQFFDLEFAEVLQAIKSQTAKTQCNSPYQRSTYRNRLPSP